MPDSVFAITNLIAVELVLGAAKFVIFWAAEMRNETKLLAAFLILSFAGVSCSISPRLIIPRGPTLTAVSDGNLVLSMKNESSVNPPIDFQVFIDGRAAYSDEIGLTPHRYTTLQFSLARGKHSVFVKSDKADIWAAQSVEIDEKLWVYITYWHYPGRDAGPYGPYFQISNRLKPAEIY